MKITKWRFLIIFWLLAVVFLIGEFWLVKWRYNKLFNEKLMNSMMYDLKPESKINNVCKARIDARGITYNLVKGYFYCKDGNTGFVPFSRSVITGGYLKNYFKEVDRLVYQKVTLNTEDWKCVDANKKELNNYSVLGEGVAILCYEK